MSVSCTSSSIPGPPTYSWTGQQSSGDSQLVMNDIKSSQTGTYICKVTNNMNPTVGPVVVGRNQAVTSITVMSECSLTGIEFGCFDPCSDVLLNYVPDRTILKAFWCPMVCLCLLWWSNHEGKRASLCEPSTFCGFTNIYYKFSPSCQKRHAIFTYGSPLSIFIVSFVVSLRHVHG